MQKMSSRWKRGFGAGLCCACLVFASACDDEPRWTWAEWVQFDAGLRVSEAGAAPDGGVRDGAVSDGSSGSQGGDGAVDGAVEEEDAGAVDATADDAGLVEDAG